MEEIVKLASIGVGWWGGVLADAASTGGAAEVVSCFARSREQREAFAERRGCRAAGSLEELLVDPEVEGVVIATSHSSHRSLVERAAEAGKHIFVEKPLTLRVDDGLACVRAAAAAHVVLQVGHQRRRQAANRRIKEMIDAGALGDLQVLESNLSLPNGLRMPPDAWRWEAEEAPLGSMTSLGIHHIDTITYLAGPVRSVFAHSRPGRRHSIDEATVLALELESGALGSVITSFFSPSVSRLAVFGSAGAAYNERDGAMLAVQEIDEDGPSALDIVPNDPVTDQMAEFVRAVRGKARPETDGTAGVEVVRVLEAAVESSQTGRAVDVVR